MAAMLKLVILYALLAAAARIRAYEMAFSNQTIPDLGGIDVGKLIMSDWLLLPVEGSCGLAAKYITLHVFNASSARGTLHTTFEFLTQDCTAEYKHDINMCALIDADFAMCLQFPFDARTSHSPWGYCSNQNSRVSYLWIPENSTTMPLLPPQQQRSSSDREQSNLLLVPLLPSPPPPSPPPPSPPPPSPPPPLSPPPSSTPPVCLSHGLPNKTATNPEALAKLYKDHVALSRIAASRVQTLRSMSTETMDFAAKTMDSRYKTLGRKVSRGEIMNKFRNETLRRPDSLIQPTDFQLQPLATPSCDWRHSNIIPVAFDGVQNVLMAGHSLRSPDGTYALTMQYDCNLVVYKKRPDGRTEWNAKWASFSQFNDPFQRECYMEMQPDGNLVVKDPLGTPRWSSGGTAPSLYSTALSIISCGNVIVLDMTSGAIVWATHTGHT